MPSPAEEGEMLVPHGQIPRSFVARLRSGAPTRYTRHQRRDIWVLAVGFTLLAGCMLVVRSGDVSGVEKSVFRAINGLPDALRAPMWVFQIFGSLAFVALAAVAAMATRRLRLGLVLAAAIPLKLAFEWWVVKALVERERPFFTVLRGNFQIPANVMGHKLFYIFRVFNR